MKATVYVDGSFKMKNGKGFYGGGIVLFFENIERPLYHKCAGTDTNVARLRNVAGELMAVVTTIGILQQFPNVTDLEIRYDYEGIEKWITGEWQAKQAFTRAYRDAILKAMSKLRITFKHVPAHTGVKYNEEADKLAKQAIDDEVERLANEITGCATEV